MIQKQITSDLYTEREAAKFLRISVTTLWRERKRANITFRRASTKLLYTRADLENYLERNKTDACAA
jgi:hypothetical protein